MASNVVLLRFSKKMAYLNVNYHFVYIMKIHKFEVNIFIEEICSQRHTHKQNKYHDDVFIISYTTKVIIYCLPMMFVDVGI